MDTDAVRRRFRDVRSETGLSQTAFAQKLGMPFRTYQALEGGERGVTIEAVDALYEHCGINPLWLLRGVGQKRGDSTSVAVAVFRGLVERWNRYPVVLTVEEQVDDFARVLEHANKIGISEELLDVAVRRVG